MRNRNARRQIVCPAPNIDLKVNEAVHESLSTELPTLIHVLTISKLSFTN